MSGARIDQQPPQRLPVLAGVWLTAVTAGLCLLADYGSRPGPRASPAPLWPASASLARDLSRPTGLMFLHSHCPCSRASLSELERLAYDSAQQIDLRVVFTQPLGVPAGWAQSDLWERAVANPDWRVVMDPEHHLADQFGVQTSGHLLIYDSAGRLRYDGGITPGRGHVGASVGHDAVRSLISGDANATPSRCAVFGCSLAAMSPPVSSVQSP